MNEVENILERVKAWANAGKISADEILDRFPELKESEDERIRKEIVDEIKEQINNIPALDCCDSDDLKRLATLKSWIAYLEKKPAEWSEDWREEDIRTRFAFYTYKNEEDDCVLYLSNVFVEEASRNHGFGTKILAAAEKVAETIGAITIRLKVKQNSPANTWYRKHGYSYMAFEGDYDWLEKTLEYMKPVKQEWSEEDSKRYVSIRTTLGTSAVLSKEDYDANVVWLRDLVNAKKYSGSKPSWKPSEEQMAALYTAAREAPIIKENGNYLYDLYADLQKLL